MNIIVRENSNILYKLIKSDGYRFNSSKISNLVFYDYNIIRHILFKRVTKDYTNCYNSIIMMLVSKYTIISDCDLIINELFRISYNLSTMYYLYFNEFEYFKLLQRLYILYQSILAKKVLISD